MVLRRRRSDIRFLGWREFVGVTPAGNFRHSSDIDEKHQFAIWSDEGFGVTDGFDLNRWRSECDADLEGIDARQSGRADSRISELQSRVSPSPGCGSRFSEPRASPLQKFETPTSPERIYLPQLPSVLDPHLKTAVRRAANGGKELKRHAAPQQACSTKSPYFEELLPALPMPGGVCPSPQTQRKDNDKNLQDQIARADAALFPHDSYLNAVLRGGTRDALEELARARAQLAQDRRGLLEKQSQQERRLAARWREQQDAKAEAAKACVELQVITEREDAEREGSKQASRVSRLTRVLDRIKTGKRKSDVCGALIDPEVRETQVSYRRADSSTDRTKQKIKGLKQNILTKLETRHKAQVRLDTLRSQRKSAFMVIPVMQRQLLREHFDFHKNEEDGLLRGKNIMRSLLEAGLSGNTPEERHNLDRIVKIVVQACACRRGSIFEVEHHVYDATCESSGAQSESRLRRNCWQRGITLEDFCSEVIPAARRILHETRIDDHFHAFSKVHVDPTSVYISHEQFQELCLNIGFDQQLVERELEELPQTVVCPFRQRHRRASAGDATLDFETVSRHLLNLEETRDRMRRAQEHSIKTTRRLSDASFWLHREELLPLYERFGIYDRDHSGYLTPSETKALLKSMGLQPYVPNNAAVIESWLKFCDKDGNAQLDFAEFLHLMEQVRSYQMQQRYLKLRQEFESFDSDGNAVLEPREMMNGLIRAKVVKTMHDRDVAWNVINDFEAVQQDGITLQAYPALIQRVVELVFSKAFARGLALGERFGLDRELFEEYQWVFDHLDEDNTGGLSTPELLKALGHFLAPPPSPKEVEEVFNAIGLKDTSEISFEEFLRFMNTISSGHGIFSKAAPYTLRGVSNEKLREVLSVFPISHTYIVNLEPDKLLETVSYFLDKQPDANLRDLEKPIRNNRGLLEYARSLSGGVGGGGGGPVGSWDVAETRQRLPTFNLDKFFSGSETLEGK